MAVEERAAGMIGGELNLRSALCGDQEDVLHQSCHTRAVADTHHLESVAMEVDGMVVGAQVLHHQSIPLSRRQHRLIRLWIGLAVDEPELFISVPLKLRVECEFDASSIAANRG